MVVDGLEQAGEASSPIALFFKQDEFDYRSLQHNYRCLLRSITSQGLRIDHIFAMHHAHVSPRES